MCYFHCHPHIARVIHTLEIGVFFRMLAVTKCMYACFGGFEGLYLCESFGLTM